MRNRWYLFFWTELGRRITGAASDLPVHLPGPMIEVLRRSPPLPGPGGILTGQRQSGREARYIYDRVWRELRTRGFSRPLRLQPWPGISLLIPFFRGDLCVLPQSFSSRIPSEERALALVGKSAAACEAGYRLLVVMANWNNRILSILERGGVQACSPDMLDRMMP